MALSSKGTGVTDSLIKERSLTQTGTATMEIGLTVDVLEWGRSSLLARSTWVLGKQVTNME